MRGFHSKTLIPLLFAAVFALPGCSWFLIGGVAAGLYALQEEENSPPAVGVENPVRLKTSPGMILYTLFDSNDDACSITVEYSVGGGPFAPATEGTGGDGTWGLSSSSGGRLHVFSWDFATDIAPPRSDVRIRIAPTDGDEGGPAVVSGSFYAGDDLPVIESITAPTGNVTGTVTLKYTISDTESDPARIQVQFNRLSVGGTWVDAAPEDPIAGDNISTAVSPGIEHLFPWDSDAPGNMDHENDQVNRIRIRASDDGGANWGNWFESAGTITILNNTAPRIEIASVNPLRNGLVTIPYSSFDGGSHPVSVLCEYLEAGRIRWRRATAGPGTTPLFMPTSPGGTPGVFVWDSRKDGIFSNNVSVRLTPSESGLVGVAGSTNFFIGNRESDAWFAKTAMPTARRGLGCVAASGKIYAIGGDDGSGTALDAVEEYDPATDTWKAMAPMPTARRFFAVAEAGGKIYAMGGLQGANYLSVVESFDPGADAWSTKAPMPTARANFSCALARGILYAVAGWNGSALSMVEAYDPVADAWSAKTAIPTARANFCVASVNGKIYAIGGEDGAFLVPAVEAYDPVADAWTMATVIPTQRERLTCSVVGGRIYTFGAMAAGSVPTTVEAYDPGSNLWTTESAMPTGRWSLASAPFGGRVYVVGGFNGFVSHATVEAYDPASHTWTARTPMPTARNRTCTVSAGGKLYVVGGRNGSGVLATLEAYDPQTDTWTTRTAMPAARQSLSCAAVGGKVYAIGGDDGATTLATVGEYDPAGNNWTPKTAMPTARSFAACCPWGGKIYVIGGWNGANALASVEEYDPAGDAWSVKTAMPTARARLAAVVVGGIVYAIGGEDASVLALVEAYDPVRDTWSAKAPLAVARSEFSCSTAGGKIFAIGGWNGAILSSVEVYDPVRDTWTGQAPIPTSRTSRSWAAVGTRVYAVGGWDGSTYLASAEELFVSAVPLAKAGVSLVEGAAASSLIPLSGNVYLTGGRTASASARPTHSAVPLTRDISPSLSAPFSIQPSWSAKAPMIASRTDAGSGAHGGYGYVVGGFDGSGTPLASMERYDPASDTWTALVATLTPARGGSGVVSIGDRMYVFGGDTGGGAKTGALEVYDLLGAAWVAGPFSAMNTARSHFGSAAIEGRVYAFGGEGAGPTRLASVERYDPAAGAWTTLNNLPAALEGCLCLRENGRWKLFGGELAGGRVTDRILVYDHDEDSWRVEEATLPYAARDMIGCTAVHTWQHRGNPQTREFCLLGGGFDGSGFRDGFFRFWTR